MESVETKEINEIQDMAEKYFSDSSDALFVIVPEKNIVVDCNNHAVVMFESDDKSSFINIELKTLNKKPSKKDYLFNFIDELETLYRELEFITSKGREFWGEMSVKKVFHNGEDLYLIKIVDITERRMAETEISKNSQFIQKIANASPNNIYVLSLKNHSVTYSNNKLAKALGYSYSQIKDMGKDYPACLMDKEDSIQYYKNLKMYEYIEDSEVFEHEYKMKDRRGKWHWISFRSSVFSRNEDNSVKEIIGIAQDITLRKQYEYDNIRLAAFTKANPNPVLECDFQGNITYVNPRAYNLITEMGVTLEEIIHPNHKNICCGFTKEDEVIKDCELTVKDRVISWSYHPVSEIGYIHIYGVDITEQKQSEDKLIHDALHDILTGLPNRALFLDRLDNSFARMKRRPKYNFAALFVDLDRFKIVNDSLGHMAGDQLLIQLSSRLKDLLRPTDTIARLGGDEFTILIDEINGIGDVVTVAERIKKALSLPFKIDDHEIFTTASMGIALSTTEGNNSAEDMMRNADMAMYKAKAKGKNRFEIFNSVMYIQAKNSLKLETELWKAIENNEFFMEYQPIVSLQTKEIISYEALIRWNHPKKGVIYPKEFISTAEDAGLVTHLDMWVLNNVCKQIKTWQKSKKVKKDFSISINLSGKNFMNNTFSENVKEIIKKNKIDSSFIKFEITESVMLEGNDHIFHILCELGKMNIQLQIDNFGTGYSSLIYLHKLPINALKIDKSFITNLGVDTESYEISKTIIMLASNLGIYVIAEGVETERQLEELKKLNCHFAQGELFFNPLDSKKVAALLK